MTMFQNGNIWWQSHISATILKTTESFHEWFVWFVNCISKAVKNEGKIKLFYDKWKNLYNLMDNNQMNTQVLTNQNQAERYTTQ